MSLKECLVKEVPDALWTGEPIGVTPSASNCCSIMGWKCLCQHPDGHSMTSRFKTDSRNDGSDTIIAIATVPNAVSVNLPDDPYYKILFVSTDPEL